MTLIVRAVAFVILSVPMFFIATEGIFGGRGDFLLLSGVFMAYALTEVYVFARQRHTAWLMNMPVLTTLYVFFIGYGLTNFLCLIPGFEYGVLSNLVAGHYQWLSYAVYCAMLGVFAMWVGFGFGFGASVGDRLRRSLLSRNLLRTQFQPRWSVVFGLIVVSLVARVIQWQLRLYGVLALTQGTEPPAYNQYLLMSRELGLIALLVASITYFSRPAGSAKLRLLVVGMVLHECAWGMLAAQKTMIVIPIVMVGLCHYTLRGRIPKSWVVGSVFALAVGFLVTQPLRRAGFDEGAIEFGSVASATTAIVLDQWGSNAIDADFGTSASERINNTGRTALGVWFRTEGAQGRKPPADLLMLLVTAPVAAIIPRALWPNKPHGGEIASWAFSEVRGGNPDAATKFAFGSVGYLYLAGGALVVVFGFLILGVAQRMLWSAFVHRQSGGLLVFLGLVPHTVLLYSAFYSVFIDGIRDMILLLIIQYIVFKGIPSKGQAVPRRVGYSDSGRPRSVHLGGY